MSSLASLGSIDGNTVAVGTLLGSLSIVSLGKRTSIENPRCVDARDFLPNLANSQLRCVSSSFLFGFFKMSVVNMMRRLRCVSLHLLVIPLLPPPQQ